MHNLTLEVTRVTQLDRTDGSGHLRSIFGYAQAPDGIDGAGDGTIAVDTLTVDAPMYDSSGAEVVAGGITEFSDVLLERKLDQNDNPSTTGKRKTPVYRMRFTASSGAHNCKRGLSFGPSVDALARAVGQALRERDEAAGD